MAVHSFKATQKIPVSLAEAWAFFSNPDNLALITPPSMKFTVTSQYHGDIIYPGQVIEYRVRPLWNIRVYWMTEIIQVDAERLFVDEQRYGPYSMWHHQHHFKAIDGGVEMTDIVHYKLPLWFLGELMHVLVVKKKLQEIFDYRYRQVEILLGKWSAVGNELTS